MVLSVFVVYDFSGFFAPMANPQAAADVYEQVDLPVSREPFLPRDIPPE